MKVYVAGHNGFVGKNVFNKLKELNYDVVIAPRDLDLRNQEMVNYFFKLKKPEWVFTCAAVVGGIAKNMKEPYKFLMDNLQIQNNIIDCSIKYGVKKVLFMGSSCVYPKDYRQPLREDDLLAAPLEPTNEGYAIAKIAGLKLCEYANKVQDTTKFISLMPCNLYGPYDCFDINKSHVLSALVKKVVDAYRNGENTVNVWGSGNPKREWLYIDDLVDAIIWSMHNLEKTDQFLNVGVGYDITIKELVYKIADIVEYRGDFDFDLTQPDGMLYKCMDVSKINNLGWKAKISFETGLKNTIEYYKSL